MDRYPWLVNSDNSVIIVINSSPFTFGRAWNCNHVMVTGSMSRIHCSLEKVSNHWILKVTSTNRTSVNGMVIQSGESHQLMDGDIINFHRRNEKYIFRLIPRGSIWDEQQSRVVEPLPSQIGIYPNYHVTVTPYTTVSTYRTNFMFRTDPTYRYSPSSVPAEVAGPSNTPQECTRRGEMPKATNSSETENGEGLQDEMRCSICSELFIKATTLNCSHTFCKFCIETWRKNKSACPNCRAKITSMNPTLVLDNVIKMVVQNGSEEVKQHRKKVLEDRWKCVKPSNHENRGPSTEEPNNPRIPEELDILRIQEEPGSNDESDSDWNNFLDAVWWSRRRAPTNQERSYIRSRSCYCCGNRGHWSRDCPSRERIQLQQILQLISIFVQS